MELQIHLLASSFLVVEKPAGLLTVPGRGPEKQDCLLSRVLVRFPEVRLVHRLDMGTSGLVLFARSPEAQRQLSRQFERREVEKEYEALVEGTLRPEEGRVCFSMRKDMAQRLPPRHVVDCVRGKKAVTRWKVVAREAGRSRVALYPETGRSHQLRVHMQALGHPIAGDPIYGTAGGRLLLHARRLCFRCPESGRTVQAESPVPF